MWVKSHLLERVQSMGNLKKVERCRKSYFMWFLRNYSTDFNETCNVSSCFKSNEIPYVSFDLPLRMRKNQKWTFLLIQRSSSHFVRRKIYTIRSINAYQIFNTNPHAQMTVEKRSKSDLHSSAIFTNFSLSFCKCMEIIERTIKFPI